MEVISSGQCTCSIRLFRFNPRINLNRPLVSFYCFDETQNLFEVSAGNIGFDVMINGADGIFYSVDSRPSLSHSVGWQARRTSDKRLTPKVKFLINPWSPKIKMSSSFAAVGKRLLIQKSFPQPTV